MKVVSWRRAARWMVVAVAWGVIASRAAAALPTEAFGKVPAVEDVTLSPDGTRFAAVINSSKGTFVAVRPVDGSEPFKVLMKADDARFHFRWIHWANDDRLLLSLQIASERYGTPTIETRLFSLARDGSSAVDLAGSHGTGWAGTQVQDRVIDWMPDDGHHVLMAMNDGDDPLPSVFRVDIDNHRHEVVQIPRADTVQWMTDQAHRPRIAIRQVKEDTVVEFLDVDTGQWHEAWRFAGDSDKAVWPLGFGKDPNQLYVTAYHQDREATFVVDLKDPALTKRLLLSDPELDLTGDLVRDPVTDEVVGQWVPTEGDGGGIRFWASGFDGLLKGIDKALPSRRNEVIEFSRKGQRYLVRSEGNGVPPQYLVGDRRTGTLAMLADPYPDLPDHGLAKKQPFIVKARDGLELHALLTTPVGREPKALPLVVLPHGGPVSHDALDFDPMVAFLADRGYAVLQVNFRGSSGFGHALRQAGMKQWGLHMQDDITDAVKAVIANGTADAQRVCIVGGSYGGYAALMGAVKTPELYRCIVSFAGVSDLRELAEYERQYVGGIDAFEHTIGSVWDDSEQLRNTSPRRLADKVQAPVLLVHGELDRSVPIQQSELMESALKRAGKPVTFVRQPNGDHHLSTTAQRLEFFHLLEQFLARNLGGRTSAVDGR